MLTQAQRLESDIRRGGNLKADRRSRAKVLRQKGRIILNLDGENKSEFAEMKDTGKKKKKKATEFGRR